MMGTPPRDSSAAEKLILRWDPKSGSGEVRGKMMIFSLDREEIDRYLDAVDELQKSLHATAISSDSPTLQIAVSRLEEEFRSILLSHTSSVLIEPDSVQSEFAPEDFELKDEIPEINLEKQFDHQGSNVSSSSSYRQSTRSIRELDLIPNDAVYDLRCIAERMIAAGYSRECIQVYASVRKPAVLASMKELEVEKLSIGDIQRMDWRNLETKIRRWIRAAKNCIRVLFASERRLCEHIFEGLGSSADDTCFMETIKGPAMQLFNFAEAISISKRSPEKLFKILDLHDTLSELMPDIETVFDQKSNESIRVQAAEILSRLAEAARGILSEFENAVLREPSKIPVPGGALHPLTRYVMNYIGLITEYKQTLVDVIVSRPWSEPRFSGGDPDMPEINLLEFEDHASSPLQLHLIWIIMLLQFNLEEKSQHYKDPSLSHLFMMNNVHYIVQKIKGMPELRTMIGDDYLKKLTGKFRSSATNYQRSTWVRVLHCLRDEGLHGSSGSFSGVSKTALRERFKSFNAMFDEVHRTQATWIIPDTQLREELRISMSERLIPAYRSFFGRFRSHIESGRHPENYIKYSEEDLSDALLDFFEGSPLSQHTRRRSQAGT